MPISESLVVQSSKPTVRKAGFLSSKENCASLQVIFDLQTKMASEIPIMLTWQTALVCLPKSS